MQPGSAPTTAEPALGTFFLVAISAVQKDQGGLKVERNRICVTPSPSSAVGDLLADMQRQGDSVQRAPLELDGRLVVVPISLVDLAQHLSALPVQLRNQLVAQIQAPDRPED